MENKSVPFFAPGQCAHLCWTHVANSFDEAWDNVQDHLHYQYSLYAKWLAEAGERQPVAVPPAEAFRHMGNELGILAVGDPDQVAEKILALTAETRTTHLVLGMNIAGLSPEKSRSSIELFAREVMPRLR